MMLPVDQKKLRTREDAMGRTVVKAKLTNVRDMGVADSGLDPATHVRQLEVEFLVDTGAAMLCLPLAMIEKLGLRKDHDREVITGNGVVTRGVYSPVKIELQGRQGSAEVVESFDADGPQLGWITGDALGFYPIERRRNPDLRRMREGFERGFGACKDDPTVAEAFAQVERERGGPKP